MPVGRRAPRTPAARLRALAVPAISVLLTVLILSYSRGALIAGVVGLGCWFALVPLRLRATLLLAAGRDRRRDRRRAGRSRTTRSPTTWRTLAARTTAGHEFGVVLLAVVALMTIVGLAAAFAQDRRCRRRRPCAGGSAPR